MVNDALMSSLSPNWGTPRPFLENLQRSLNFEFSLDPCARNAKEAVTPNFYTPHDNGLVKSWEGHNVFVNPPYGREIKFWANKICKEANRGTKIVFLGPSRTDTQWYEKLDLNLFRTTTNFVSGRLAFIDLDAPTDKLVSAPFPSVIMTFNLNHYMPGGQGIDIPWFNGKRLTTEGKWISQR